MRLCLQRVLEGSVSVDGRPVAAIETGIVALVGFGKGEDAAFAHSDAFAGMARKLVDLRIFPGEGPHEHKMHRTVAEVGGAVLLVPQFTLYADCRRGRRPDFIAAAAPDAARELFAAFVRRVDGLLPGNVHSGIFGADMRVFLRNWGPVTLWLDSADLFPTPAKA